jgi:hypothetical protein
LLSVHNAWDNFHNEPPFAERLLKLSQKNRVPETAQAAFVEAVVTAGVGNPYGVSHGAKADYLEMVKSFSPNEVRIMLDLTKGGTLLARRIDSNKGCERRFRALVASVDPKSVPTSSKSLYKKWLPTT